ncbi:methyltransferase domain-containing protein [Nocardia sp. CDC159]|uniref:Methyltransferase domain-containing protein n=1 Tax=Nocardia pulmonis TaxID=2951408 RepID=A0A9X2EDW5_9NOCA|nr:MULTISPECIES: class I SAM-dependent methyltransferase [Nocardia]MCM6778566.1 methyltransferase domain-containing protein [Nocardia pulmonis]MCM6791455.1 methyltransferase domain-containing protein [Nocardia sp. CDC159]
MTNSKLSAGGIDDADRLRVISGAADAPSRAVITALELPPAPTVLDIGAGNGSIARWVADTYPEGRVTALDKDIALLASEPVPGNCTIVAADIADYTPEPDSFDLVHARFVLAHLADRDRVCARALQWIRPGGYFVVTEPFSLGSCSRYPVAAEVLGAYERYCEATGFDLTWARRVPAVMQAAGARVVEVRAAAGRLGGGTGVDRWQPLIARVAEELVAAGLDRVALDQFAALCADPETYDIPQVIMTVVGRRPA